MALEQLKIKSASFAHRGLIIFTTLDCSVFVICCFKSQLFLIASLEVLPEGKS